MRAFFILVFLVLAGWQAGAQEVQLPPGVLLLSRIKRHVKQGLDQLPAYTCLETVQRSMSRGQRKGLEPLDTVRLEILYTGRKELYASPGARTFSSEHPAAFTTTGMIGDGIFATHLSSVFLSEVALFQWRGEDNIGRDRGWSNAVKYDYRIPAMQSGWIISLPSGSGTVGSKGSFWADPETLELLKLEIHADEIPSTLALADASLISTYARMRIGDEDIMLPQTAELRLVELGGREDLDQFEFTHCRSYQAESSISFETADAPVPIPQPNVAVKPVSAVRVEDLPAGLIVPVTLTTAVASDSSVGSLLEGRISTDVALKGKVLIPAGALVHGRIRRLERYTNDGVYYAAGLEFTEVEANGALLRFYADLQSASGAPGLEWEISTGARRGPGMVEMLHPPDLPGVGSFFIRGSKFSLPAGFRMQWKTRAIGQ